MVHTMLHGTQLPKNLWGEALAHAIWLKNRTSTKALEQTMPLQALIGTKPDLSELHKWGRRVVVHNTTNSKLGRWVGLDTESKASFIYLPDKTMVSIKHNFKFDHNYVLVSPNPSLNDPAPTEPKSIMDTPSTRSSPASQPDAPVNETTVAEGRGALVKWPIPVHPEHLHWRRDSHR